MAKAKPTKTAKTAARQDDCCGHDHVAPVCCGTKGCCTGFWGTAVRLWWAVAWRTFFWVTLPMMAVQVGVMYLINPAIVHQIKFQLMMLSAGAGVALRELSADPAFWFMAAVTVYSFLGGIYVFGHVAKRGIWQRICDKD
ncbi:MAG: hypothetical protein H6922_01190 [Pseudomonadaceae bacterium]|nr:hypothetical protein [Pseudomonadaceae bacterium]